MVSSGQFVELIPIFGLMRQARQGGVTHTHTLTVGQSVTAVKVKVKGQGYRFLLSQWSRSLLLVNGQ